MTVASFQSGVGKTATALHLAAYLKTKAPTLLVDGDQSQCFALGSARFLAVQPDI
ncbi:MULTISPECIES: hypothetical protein [unclassified Microcoleus]|uniref:ParA family protein n=1 Tax=unclassified Microcoleus TaxID=2642155 RepID=UPI0025F99312|nr:MULTISPECIES: hypothetical protein [unclassified Microcoleus]